MAARSRALWRQAGASLGAGRSFASKGAEQTLLRGPGIGSSWSSSLVASASAASASAAQTRATSAAAAHATSTPSTGKLRSVLAAEGQLTTGTREQLVERIAARRPTPRAPGAEPAGASAPAPGTATATMPEDAEAAAVRSIEAAASATELAALLGRIVKTWGGAPSAQILLASLRRADRLDALHLAYAIVYQVRLFGTTQYVKRLTPAVYEALVLAAARLAGDRDVVVLSDRMLQDAILPTPATFAILFQVLLRTGDQRRLWTWYTEYRARPRPAPGAPAGPDTRVPPPLEAAVRRFLHYRPSGATAG